MKTDFVKAFAFSVAFAAAAFVGSTGAAVAGGPTHTMPAATNQVVSAYEIRVVSTPTDGRKLVVQVVNKNTGQPVANAHVSMRHWNYSHVKAAPLPQIAMIPLDPDGRGNYICTREHLGHGEHIIIRAHVPGEAAETVSELSIDN